LGTEIKLTVQTLGLHGNHGSYHNTACELTQYKRGNSQQNEYSYEWLDRHLLIASPPGLSQPTQHSGQLHKHHTHVMCS